MRRKTHLLMLLGLLACVGAVWGQVRISVDRTQTVLVPVNVRGTDGRLVIGLARDDFSVFEDGRQHPLSYFSADPKPLSAAIVIDDGMGGNTLKQLLPSMQVLTSGFAPEDEMVAFRYDHFVWKLSDFTHEPLVIQRAFNEIPRIAETRPALGEPGQPAATAPSFLRSLAGLITIGSNGAPKPIPSGADMPKRPQTSRLLHDAIFEAATVLKARPADRRKIIFIISDGQVSGQNKQSLGKNTDFLVENDIQVYAVAMDFALRELGVGVLNSYADASGGDVYGGGSTRDLENAFTRITEQARNQYILGYVSDNRPRTGGIFRTIDVKVNQPNQKVTHRKGYTQFPAPVTR
jgi:VWFA-related protein